MINFWFSSKFRLTGFIYVESVKMPNYRTCCLKVHIKTRVYVSVPRLIVYNYIWQYFLSRFTKINVSTITFVIILLKVATHITYYCQSISWLLLVAWIDCGVKCAFLHNQHFATTCKACMCVIYKCIKLNEFV